MTVSTTETSVSYIGDGSTTVFAFTFACLSPGEILAYEDGIPQSPVVTLNADQSTNPGGSVELSPAPTGTVLIMRDTAITQQTDYNAYDPFPAETHEMALDRLTLICQDIMAALSNFEGITPQYVDVPATANSPGVAGTIAYDTDYLYVCVDTDTWKRATLETWT